MSGPAPVVTLLPAAGYRAMPWRNGRGTTTEIALADGPDGRFLWRVSIADVPASGPFSLFAGYDRLIAVVEGAGMRLAVGDRHPVRLDQASDPYAFLGDVATDCTLVDGPIRDFNLMVDRAHAAASLARLRVGSAPAAVPLDGTAVLLHALAGALTVDLGALGRHAVPEGDTLMLDGTGARMIVAGRAGGQALLAAIRPR